MILFHLANFAVLEVLYVLIYIDEKHDPHRTGWAHIPLKIANTSYYTYMTFVLFCLIHRFGKNRHFGSTVKKGLLSEKFDEETLSEKQKLQKNYWRWLMKTVIYEGVEYGKLDQAVLQEYVDIDSIRQRMANSLLEIP